MASTKRHKSKYLAKIVTGKKSPCAFCFSSTDDEVNYGKIYSIGDIQCHYFCVLLSSCLVQRGKEEEGLLGFLYEDIVAEVERCKKHKCSFCKNFGASLGCSVTQCRKQFHLSCGKDRGSVSMFYGTYKSFCKNHAPKQKVPETIMSKARRRMKVSAVKAHDNFRSLKELSSRDGDEGGAYEESVCVICYEPVDGFPTNHTFWPPCCARDAWFHRACLQRMSLSAGAHYIKCPLCNDKDIFYDAVIKQGYYVPDRDAAWELEQNAFAEIYERVVRCGAGLCSCEHGREHTADAGPWDMRLCLLCGSAGVHVGCSGPGAEPYVCAVCEPAAPTDIDKLASSIEAVIIQEQERSASQVRSGPVMPSRMSLRRTKRLANRNTMQTRSSSQPLVPIKTENKSQETPTLVPPSPTKLLLLSASPSKILSESARRLGSSACINHDLVEQLRTKFKKPKPLCEKRKIVSDILNGLFDKEMYDSKETQDFSKRNPSTPVKTESPNIVKSSPIKQEPRTPLKNLPQQNQISKIDTDYENYPILSSLLIKTTPKKRKTVEIEKDSSLEISENDEIINIDMIKVEPNDNSTKNITSINKIYSTTNFNSTFEDFSKEKVPIDIETFKNQYLNEVRSDAAVNKHKNGQKKSKKSSKKRRKTKLKKHDVTLKYDSAKIHKNISIKNNDIKVKIQWKRKELNLQITDGKRKKTKDKRYKKMKKELKKIHYKQYILQYTSEVDNTTNLCRPENDVTPIKKKRIKLEKSPDNMVQTNIDKFFKIKPHQE